MGLTTLTQEDRRKIRTTSGRQRRLLRRVDGMDVILPSGVKAVPAFWLRRYLGGLFLSAQWKQRHVNQSLCTLKIIVTPPEHRMFARSAYSDRWSRDATSSRSLPTSKLRADRTVGRGPSTELWKPQASHHMHTSRLLSQHALHFTL